LDSHESSLHPILMRGERVVKSFPDALLMAVTYVTTFFHTQRKEFVYRGREFERLPAFTQLLRDEFPGVDVAPFSSAADDEVDEKQSRILVCGVQPCEDDDDDDAYLDSEDGPACRPSSTATSSSSSGGLFPVPPRVRQSRRRCGTTRFKHDRPFHKGPKDKENEFKVTTLLSHDHHQLDHIHSGLV